MPEEIAKQKKEITISFRLTEDELERLKKFEAIYDEGSFHYTARRLLRKYLLHLEKSR